MSGIAKSARRTAGRFFGGLLCAVAIFAAGCHGNPATSGYGLVWVSLTDEPGDFTSYIVNVDSITLTRSDGAIVTALATVETVDFTKLTNVAQLWGTATIPVGTYVSASIVLDYTSAQISVMVNGQPQQASVVEATTGAAVTTVTVNVALDPANPLVITPTYATTAAQRLAIDFNLALSTPTLNLATSPATVTVNPYLTAAISPPNNKSTIVRGPLINSNVDLGTFTVYVRPFYDEVDNLGSLTLFTDANTVFTINGVVSTGATGITQLSNSSAGSTVTYAYTTFTPTAAPTAAAGKYYASFVVAGSSLEDIYTQGLEGDVVARNGNTLTVQGATLSVNDGASYYCATNSIYCAGNASVILGPSTIVTADDDTALTGLNYNSIAVGQHIIARGLYSLSGLSIVMDSTGNTSTDTGSVRLISTDLWGSLVSSTAGNLLLNLQTINNWPVTDFNFAGNGTAAAPTPTGAAFAVDTGAIALPATPVGAPLWLTGVVTPFGSAPPDFTATSVNNELSVQMVGAAAPSATATCGQGVRNCIPASMQVRWDAGVVAPFSALGADGLTIDLANPSVFSAVIRIGPESIDMKTLPASPPIIATPPNPTTQATAVGANGATAPGSVPVTLQPVFQPQYSFGNPAAVLPSGDLIAPTGIQVYSLFSTFATSVTAALAANPAVQFEARGTYDRATNTFTAITVNLATN